MSERYTDSIWVYLQKEDVQERIRHNIERGRSELTVTIGRAARLFSFSENQLRDWENRGLLTPQRSKEATGQRQYTPAELNKLAIIRELIDANYAPGEIPSDIDKIWESTSRLDGQQGQILNANGHETESEHLSIDQRVEQADQEFFWRYFAAGVLRLSLMLLSESIPGTILGLILPLRQNAISYQVRNSKDLSEIGQSLIGWLGLNNSSYVFLDPAPFFEYYTDFRIELLQAREEDKPKDGTLIFVQRKARPFTLSTPVVETIRRLLSPIYEDVQDWRVYFGQGMRDQILPMTDFNRSMPLSDDILNHLADMIVRLGGQANNGQQRWRFCCMMLPADPMLPLQQRRLVVRGQSKYSPHKVGVTIIAPGRYVNSLSLRALQSGHIIYRPQISDADSTIALRELEGPIRSAIAVPVGSESGRPVAVLYVVSDEVDAFSTDDQRALRLMGRIVEELLLAYHNQHQVLQHLERLITSPRIVDPLFGGFFSENEFIQDVEALLSNIKTRMDERERQLLGEGALLIDHAAPFKIEQAAEEVVSFISLDVDNQSRLSSLYGDAMTRNLSRTIGLRVQGLIQALITKHTDCKLYHIYADRYYLLLRGISLEESRAKAEAMRQSLEGPISIEQLTPPARPLVLPDITIRLGVTSYTYEKLEENLVSVNPLNMVAEVRAKIARALDVALNSGMDEGGNVVLAWDRESTGFKRWPPKN